jgi:hypothetical protein
MPKRTDEKTIAETRYIMESLGGVTQQELVLLVWKPLSAFLEKAATEESLSAIGELLEGFEGDEPEITAHTAGPVIGPLMRGLGAMLQELPAANLKRLTDALAAKTTVGVIDVNGNGRERLVPLTTIYNDHFDGELDRWLAWVAWGVTFNRLFGSALERFATLRAKASSSDSPKASTGSSGGSSPTPA